MPLDVTDPSGVETPQEPISLPSLGMTSIDDVLAAAAGETPEEPAAPQPAAPVVPPAPAAPAVAQAPEPPVAAQPAMPPELARLMTSLQEKEQLLDRRLQEAEEARKRYEPLQRYADIERDLHESDPLGALEKMGVRLEDVNKAVMENRGVNPLRSVEARMKQQVEELKSHYDQQIQELQGQARQRQEAEAMAEIQREVQTRSPILSSLPEGKGANLIWAAFQGHYQRTGQVATYEQVISQVEGQYRKLLQATLANEAVRKEFLPEASQSDAQKVTAPAEAPKTLTNRVASQVTHRPAKQPLPSDPADRLEAVLRMGL